MAGMKIVRTFVLPLCVRYTERALRMFVGADGSG